METGVAAKLDISTERGLHLVGGVVFILRNRTVVIWSRMVLKLFREKSYTPQKFRTELRDSKPAAIVLAQEIIKLGNEEYGVGTTSLGLWLEGNKFSKISGATFGIGETIIAKEIQIG